MSFRIVWLRCGMRSGCFWFGCRIVVESFCGCLSRFLLGVFFVFVVFVFCSNKLPSALLVG